MTTVSLSTIAAGIGGFKILGENPSDFATNVSVVGDLDGDGRDEALVGAFLNDPLDRTNAGAAYVVFGGNREPSPPGGNPPVLLASIAAGAGGGYKIDGEVPGDQAGAEVSSIRDISGDGRPEVLVSAPDNDPLGRTGAGAAYAVFGKADAAPVDLASIAAGAGGGYKIDGETAGDSAGRGLSPINDQNGDGLDEVVVGAPFNDPLGRAEAGAAYVAFGKPDAAPVDLASVAGGTGGFKVYGESPGDWAGLSVSQSFDLNGDGRDEVVVGAPNNDPSGRTDAGAAYVVFGKPDGAPVDLATIAAGAGGGFKIIGEAGGDSAGYSVGTINDLNGDGLPEILIGAPDNTSPDRFGAGAAYVVFGKTDTAPVDLASVAAGTGGFKIIGEAGGDSAGTSVGLSGDLNGDGLAEIVVGAPGHSEGTSLLLGAGYVVYGQAGTTPIDLRDVTAGATGIRYTGEAAFDSAGVDTSILGDIGTDGRNELLFGALNVPNQFSGEAYAVFF